jgi:hypothetical protein
MYAELYLNFITVLRFLAGAKRSRRGKLVQMTTLKPRGVEGGPKRTPPHLGDAWQNKPSYEVDEV